MFSFVRQPNLANPRSPSQNASQKAQRHIPHKAERCGEQHQGRPQSTVSAVPASLEGLYTELKSEILHFMTDFESLQRLVHASPSSYHVYTGVRQSVISTVVQREIHPDVITDALGVHEASELGSYGPGHVNPFLLKYEANRKTELAAPLSIPLSMNLLAFHKKYVEYFAKDFTSSILSLHCGSKQTQPAPPPSTAELCRI